MKKSWEKPKLIVLFRSKPEEGVLNGCKGGNITTTPQDGDADCVECPGAICWDCETIAS